MAHIRNGGERAKWPIGPSALHREVPSIVGLLAGEDDFSAIRRYRSFGFDDHAVYLRQLDGLLRKLAAQGVHTTVALFDPVEYETFCADTRLDPDTPRSRSRYIAEVAVTGATVIYRGEPIHHLVPRLILAVEQRATWECATALLARAGAGGHLGEQAVRVAFGRASTAVRTLLDALGPGAHHLVCSVPADGAPLVAVVHVDPPEDGEPRTVEAEALVFCTVLACGIATRSAAGIVLRTCRPGAPDTVRGWTLQDSWLRPLTEAEVFAAYCTDADTGEPIPPEPGVEYAAGLPLARPAETEAPGSPVDQADVLDRERPGE